MIKRKLKIRFQYAVSLLVLLPLIMITAACEQASNPTASEDIGVNQQNLGETPFNLENAGVSGEAARQLAEVRRATAHYQVEANAVSDGYLPTTDCVEIPGVAGMGYHYVNPDLFGPPEALDITTPQAILYEPQKNGRNRLVAVEYITGMGQPEIDPPMLFGEHFHWNPHLEFWALHVWLWRNNPEGIFEDWNPKVNCDYAPVEE